ncbi:MAG: NAD(P)/FAD-dependent oxidoreductase [Candidatus Izimaplasma sp.]|nr:NAD(P)/FAD-dependent oxidoreductase [Candidatus Izimaplasma bacterium]
MKHYDVVVVGAGPAGMACAINATKHGLTVLLVERDDFLGGQLIKQTHMFFGSEKQYAKTRGIDIATILKKELLKQDHVDIMLDTSALAIYDDKVITLLNHHDYIKVKANAIVVATGASEKVLAFPNNDLPGIYGAGAVQTLMNVHGVKPGKSVVMVGAGNIGLIVSYQLLQAGVDVKAVVEASDSIGGYLVHAQKLRRLGVPILTNHSVKEAHGATALEELIIWKLDENFSGIAGTEKRIETDTCCLSVGLKPSSEMLRQAGAEMTYVRSLGGYVPYINQNHETTVNNLFVCGDVSGIEEASSAMVEGFIVGLTLANRFKNVPNFSVLMTDLKTQLKDLRAGETGEHIMKGIKQIMRGDHHA